MKVVCANCGRVGGPRMRHNGSLLLGVLLLCFYIVPGVLYLLLCRRSYPVCAWCGSRAVADVHSRAGRLLQSELTRDAMRERREW